MNFMQQVATLNMVNKTKTTYAKMIFIYVCNYEASPVHLYITEDPKPSFEGDLGSVLFCLGWAEHLPPIQTNAPS